MPTFSPKCVFLPSPNLPWVSEPSLRVAEPQERWNHPLSIESVANSWSERQQKTDMQFGL